MIYFRRHGEEIKSATSKNNNLFFGGGILDGYSVRRPCPGK
jgi:hypothetical protein